MSRGRSGCLAWRGVCALSILMAGLSGCGRERAKELVIFHADSLVVPFRRLEAKFRESHPNVAVIREASGSNLAVRKILDLGRKADIIATADELLIEDLLMPQRCSWCVRFARNEIAIAYTGMSKYGSELTADNWFEVLCRDGVEFGHADPNIDPAGYRTMLMLKLADLHYQRRPAKGILAAMQARCPERNIRPDANQLLPLLEAPGGLDYVFVYLSQARQHGLRVLRLPDAINLGRIAMAKRYAQASVQLTGAGKQRTIKRIGRPIVYGIAVLNDAPSKQLAIDFVKLLVSDEGAEILAACDVEAVRPALAVGSHLPQELECLVTLKAP